jgi:hypothetical protein
VPGCPSLSVGTASWIRMNCEQCDWDGTGQHVLPGLDTGVGIAVEKQSCLHDASAAQRGRITGGEYR